MLPSLLRTLAMAGLIPVIWGQSSSSVSTSVAPITSVVGTTAATPSSASASALSTAAAASSSAAVPPRIIFDRVDTLVACDTTEVSWEVFGIFGGLYEVNLFAIDSEVTFSSASSASATAAATTSISARSVAPASSSSAVASSTSVAPAPATTPASSSVSASAARSTAIVGRALRSRQTSSPLNTTLVAGHAADEPYSFTVPLPAGSYYLVATMNDPLRTTARSNLFTVIERDDTSCLASAGGSGSSSRTSITGGIMQTPGAGSSDSSTSSGPSGGAIAGIVIGVIGGLAILAIALFFCLRRRRRQAAYQGRSVDRFAALPSASSQDGQYAPGALPMSTAAGAGAGGVYRRNSDPDEDEKDIEAGQSQDEHPYAFASQQQQQRREELVSPDSIPALGDHRRQSGPPTTHTLVPKTSMQGIIGKASESHESSANHSRSSSTGAAAAAAGLDTTTAVSGKDKDLGRSTSTKRKPVPSMGPELRGELQREKQRQMSETRDRERMPSIPGAGAGERRSYSLVPDPPLPPQ